MPRPFPVFLRSLLVACHPAGSPSWILWQWASIGWSGQKPPCQPLRAGHWEGRANDHLSLMSVQTGHGESSRLGAWFGHHGWDPSRRWEFAGLWALQLRGSSRKPSCGFSSLKVSQTWEGKMKWYFQERGLTGFLEKQQPRAYSWGRRIGVTSWLFDTEIGSWCFGIQGQQALWVLN